MYKTIIMFLGLVQLSACTNPSLNDFVGQSPAKYRVDGKNFFDYYAHEIEHSDYFLKIARRDPNTQQHDLKQTLFLLIHQYIEMVSFGDTFPNVTQDGGIISARALYCGQNTNECTELAHLTYDTKTNRMSGAVLVDWGLQKCSGGLGFTRAYVVEFSITPEGEATAIQAGPRRTYVSDPGC